MTPLVLGINTVHFHSTEVILRSTLPLNYSLAGQISVTTTIAFSLSVDFRGISIMRISTVNNGKGNLMILSVLSPVLSPWLLPFEIEKKHLFCLSKCKLSFHLDTQMPREL